MSEKIQMLNKMEHDITLLRKCVLEILSILASNDKQNLSQRIIEQLKIANQSIDNLKRSSKYDEIKDLLAKIESFQT